MGEISERLFEYLWNQTVNEKKPVEDFTNRRDNKITLLELKWKQTCFLLDGEIERNPEGDLQGHRTDNMLIVYLTATGKKAALPRSYIERTIEETTLEDFMKEVRDIYAQIVKEQTDEEPERLRIEKRLHFGKLLEEAAQMEIELIRRKNEDIWAYARRLASDRASYAKTEAIKMLKEADAEISELWHRLRYETDAKRRTLTEKVIDRMITGCLSEIDKMSEREQRII